MDKLNRQIREVNWNGYRAVYVFGKEKSIPTPDDVNHHFTGFGKHHEERVVSITRGDKFLHTVTRRKNMLGWRVQTIVYTNLKMDVEHVVEDDGRNEYTVYTLPQGWEIDT